MENYKNTSLEDLPDEVWTPIESFKDYLISNMGRVKSIGGYFKSKKHRILRQGLDVYGYCQVSLCKEKRPHPKKVHRLVAMAFIPNPLSKPQVNHKLGIKIDNRASELEWATGSENVQHTFDTLGRKGYSSNGGLLGEKNWNSKKVKQVDLATGSIIATFFGTAEASRMLKISRRGIGKAAQGTRATYKGYKWEYF